jgi:hypothetical protein
MRLTMPVQVAGRVPLSWLSARFINVRALRALQAAGRGPESSFVPRNLWHQTGGSMLAHERTGQTSSGIVSCHTQSFLPHTCLPSLLTSL